MSLRKTVRRIARFGLWLFFLMNLIAVFHSYRFTHYSRESAAKSLGPDALSWSQKLKVLFLGVDTPRPKNDTKPSQYKTVFIDSNKRIEVGNETSKIRGSDDWSWIWWHNPLY